MVQYFPIVTGSLIVSGSITATGGITMSGSIASASFAANAATASFVTLAQTASFVANAQSASNAVAAQTASYANTFTVASTLTAQTLVVQTITSSVDFVTGSTRFGSIIGNTHQFTGSIGISGSLTGINATFSGNVGVGVTNPATKFVISNAGAESFEFIPADSSNYNRLQSYSRSGGVYNTLETRASTHIWAIDATERMRINSSGNVGIGTSSPTSNYGFEKNLTIASANNAELQLSQTANSHFLSIGITNGFNFFQTTTGQGYVFYIGGTERIRITSDGDVNITGRTDRTILNVGNSSTISNNAAGRGNIIANGSSSAIIQLLTNSTERGYFFHNGTDSELWNTANGYLRFGTNNTERVRIANDGKVGIGTSTPSGSRLHVFIGNDGGSGTPGVILATSNGANDIVRFQDGTTTVAVVKNDGRFGIKTTNVSEEASLFLGAQGTNEGGQLILQRATSYASASHLDNYQNTFRVMSGTDTISSAVRFSVDMTNGSFKFGQSTTGNVATYVDGLYNATRTYTITGTTNGLIQIMVGVYLNGTGTSARAMWFGGGYLGGGSLPYTEILRVNGTYLTISAITSNASSSVFTIQNTFGNTADINIMIISSGFNASPTLTMT